MKVILQKDVPNLGDAGDMKEVADGYARNYLLPKRLVILANEGSRKAIEHQKKLMKMKKEKRQKEMQTLAGTMSNVAVTILANAGEENKLFGSVTAMDITRELAKAGYVIDKRKVQLADPIRELGEFEVSIKLGEGTSTKIKVTVAKE